MIKTNKKASVKNIAKKTQLRQNKGITNFAENMKVLQTQNLPVTK